MEIAVPIGNDPCGNLILANNLCKAVSITATYPPLSQAT